MQYNGALVYRSVHLKLSHICENFQEKSARALRCIARCVTRKVNIHNGSK